MIVVLMSSIAVAMSIYVWWTVLKVEPELPLPSLLALGIATDIGWAPWWYAPFAALVLAVPLVALTLARALSPFSYVRLLFIGWLALTSGALGACVARNIGYVVYIRQDVSLSQLLTTVPSMVIQNLPAAALARDASYVPHLLAIAFVCIAGLVLGSPVFQRPVSRSDKRRLLRGERLTHKRLDGRGTLTCAVLVGAIVWFFAVRPIATKALTSEIAPILLACATVVAVKIYALAEGVFSLRRTLMICVGVALLNIIIAMLMPVAFPEEAMLLQALGHTLGALFVSLIVMPAVIILVLWASSWHQLRRA